MSRRLTIVIEFDQSKDHDWIWDKKKWKELGCDLISLSEGDQVKRTEKFLNGLNDVMEERYSQKTIDYVEEFDWCPEVTKRLNDARCKS